MYKQILHTLFVSLCFTGIPENCKSQEKASYFDSKSSLQYGFSVRVLIGMGVHMPDRRKGSDGTPWSEYLNWRLSASGGVGSFTGDKNWLYPSFNLDMMLYQGGIGSKWPGHKRNKNFFMQSDFELVSSFSLTAGWKNRLTKTSPARPGMRNYPLYYFNTFNQPALQAPFAYSMTVATNVIWLPTHLKTKIQQLGFLNLHLDRFQFSYVNDGPPFQPPLGDKFDRLHTGGGYITYHGDDLDLINHIELGFNKFTGFSKNVYELGNRFGTGYVYHRDSAQQYYNKGRIYLNVAGNFLRKLDGGDLKNQRMGIAISVYDYPKLDVQHLIHLTGQFPLHAGPNEKFISIAPFGNYLQSKIGLQ